MGLACSPHPPRASLFFIAPLRPPGGATDDYEHHERLRLRSASNAQQERFWLLMYVFIQQLCANMDGISEEFPTVGKARKDLVAFMAKNPNVSFRRFRPEDAGMTVEAGDRICPR